MNAAQKKSKIGQVLKAHLDETLTRGTLREVLGRNWEERFIDVLIQGRHDFSSSLTQPLLAPEFDIDVLEQLLEDAGPVIDTA